MWTYVPWYDWLFAAGGLATGLYVAVFYPQIAFRLASLTPDKVWLGAIAIILVTPVNFIGNKLWSFRHRG